jgi:peptide/nickel transport system substrate-binding protein
LADDDARPILLHSSTYWQPQVKGLTLMVNSSHDGQRFEDLWLGK